MTEFLTVAAAVDDSDNTRFALQLAALIADPKNGGRVHAVHITPEISAALDRVIVPYACFGDDRDTLIAALGRDVHGHLFKRIRAALGEDPSLRVECGPLLSTLRNTLDELGPDITVFGPNSDPQRVNIGALASAFVRDATTPVVLARRTATPDIKRIVVGVDLSDACVQPVRFALDLAHRLDAKVQPIFVLPTHIDDAHRGFLPDKQNRNKKAVTARWLAIEASLGLPFPQESTLKDRLRKYIATSGDPGPKLVELSEEMSADLVVVGARSEQGLPGTLGRVAEFVARRASANVALVPYEEPA